MQRILIIYTGGTIGMKTNPETGSLAPFDFSQIEIEVPELRKLNVEIQTISFDPVIDSSNVTPEIWVDLAVLIRDNYERYDGFVVLHGTDTMAYSASALSFMLENLTKPIIFTGSQIPMGALRTDGRENLISSIEIAAHSRVPEVCIYFQTQLLRANRTTKNNAEHFDAFRSYNYPPLAEAGINIKYNEPYIRATLKSICDTTTKLAGDTSASKTTPDTLIINTKLETNVLFLKLSPGLSPHILGSILGIEGLRGVVLETYGAGNAPTDDWFFELVKDAVDRGMAILNVTQCAAGTVDMTLYDTGRRLQQAGVISGKDITSEAAITKLMYVLGKNIPHGRRNDYLRMSIRGEISE